MSRPQGLVQLDVNELIGEAGEIRGSSMTSCKQAIPVQSTPRQTPTIVQALASPKPKTTSTERKQNSKKPSEAMTRKPRSTNRPR